MNAKQQLMACGWAGGELPGEAMAMIAAWPKRGTKGRQGKRRVEKLCTMLGLNCWPGIGVLRAVASGSDYVSPAVAGVLLHRLPTAERVGFAGDADLYHAVQVAAR
jgi:hypothetical protein